MRFYFPRQVFWTFIQREINSFSFGEYVGICNGNRTDLFNKSAITDNWTTRSHVSSNVTLKLVTGSVKMQI